MLILHLRQKWMDLPNSNGVKLLLSPLSIERRQQLADAATEKPEAKGKSTFNVARFAQLVGEECLHGWQNVVGEDADGALVPLTFSPPHREALMRIDPVASFVVNTVSSLGLHLAQETRAAGNA